MIVVDSSALVTLAGAGGLSLLALSPHQAVTVSEVYRETVETGCAQGYPDAITIGKLFEQGVVGLRDPTSREQLPGISRADSLVLLLAKEVGAVALLVNDRVLVRKAEQRGLPARFTVEFVQELHQSGRISRRRRDRLFEAFVANRRYSQEFVEALRLGR